MAPIHVAFAGHGLKILDGDLEFYIEVDDKRIAKLIGLPLEGEYLFDLNKAALIFTPKDANKAFKVNVTLLERRLPKAKFSRELERDGELVLGYDTHQWMLSTNNYDCKSISSSKKLGKLTRLTMTDISRINIALAYITGQKLSSPCSSHVVSKAVGNLMGLPLRSLNFSDRSVFEVKKIIEDVSLTGHKMPEIIEPLTDITHAAYLETLLTDDSYYSYLQTVNLLGRNGITRLKSLRQLLDSPQNRRHIKPFIELKE